MLCTSKIKQMTYSSDCAIAACRRLDIIYQHDRLHVHFIHVSFLLHVWLLLATFHMLDISAIYEIGQNFMFLPAFVYLFDFERSKVSNRQAQDDFLRAGQSNSERIGIWFAALFFHFYVMLAVRKERTWKQLCMCAIQQWCCAASQGRS